MLFIVQILTEKWSSDELKPSKTGHFNTTKQQEETQIHLLF